MAGILLFSLAAEARAQPPGTKPPPRKSPASAFLTSLGVTAGGGAAIAVAASTESGELAVAGGVAMFVGPSVGRWYAGARAGTVIGLAARAVALGLALEGLHEDAQPVDSCDDDLDDCTAHDAIEARQDRKARNLYISAAVLWAGSSVWDIVRAPLDARDFNREHAVTVAPTVMPGAGSGGAALTPGLVVSGRF